MYFGGKSAPRVLLPRAAAAPPEQSPDREVIDVAADRGPAATSVGEAFFEDPAQSTAAASAPSPSPRCSDASKSRVMELINSS